MNRSLAEIAELNKWRTSRKLNVERDARSIIVEQKTDEETAYHFFNYDPSIGVTSDLSTVSVKKEDDAKASAIISIPLSFTKANRTVYKQHDHNEFGFDIRTCLTPHNAPIYPLRK